MHSEIVSRFMSPVLNPEPTEILKIFQDLEEGKGKERITSPERYKTTQTSGKIFNSLEIFEKQASQLETSISRYEQLKKFVNHPVGYVVGLGFAIFQGVTLIQDRNKPDKEKNSEVLLQLALLIVAMVSVGGQALLNKFNHVINQKNNQYRQRLKQLVKKKKTLFFSLITHCAFEKFSKTRNSRKLRKEVKLLKLMLNQENDLGKLISHSLSSKLNKLKRLIDEEESEIENYIKQKIVPYLDEMCMRHVCQNEDQLDINENALSPDSSINASEEAPLSDHSIAIPEEKKEEVEVRNSTDLSHLDNKDLV